MAKCRPTPSKSAPPPRAGSARRPDGATTKPNSAPAPRAKDRAENDPFGSRVPDHSVVHRYARCLTYPEWGVGTVAGIYFSSDAVGAGEEVQQWARVKFSHGIRTVPAGSMKFVDFSKPDPAEERVERFLIAAQRAMAEGEYLLAAQRLIYARDAEPRNVAVLRLMTLAFWNAGKLEEAARAVRDWARVDGNRPAAHRFAARIYEDMGATDLAEEAAERAALRGPSDASAWERLGRLRLTLMDREGALEALRRALALGAGKDVHDLVAQALAIEPSLAARGCSRRARRSTRSSRATRPTARP